MTRGNTICLLEAFISMEFVITAFLIDRENTDVRERIGVDDSFRNNSIHDRQTIEMRKNKRR